MRVNQLLEAREACLEKLKDLCDALHENNVDHTEYLHAFLKEGEIEKTAIVNEDDDNLPEEWPLKRIWLQFLIFKIRGALYGEETPIIDKVVQDIFLTNRKTFTKTWLKTWLHVYLPSSGGVEDVGWDLWKATLVKWKLEMAGYLYTNWDRIFPKVRPGEAEKSCKFTWSAGKWSKIPITAQKYTMELKNEGGSTLLQEVGTRNLKLQPKTCIVLDVYIAPHVVECVSEEAISVEQLLQLFSEFSDIVIGEQMKQIPGFIKCKVSLVPKTKNVLRIVIFFSSCIDESWALLSMSINFDLWQPCSRSSWFTSEKLSFQGVQVAGAFTYKNNESCLADSNLELEFQAIEDYPNPFFPLYRSFFDSLNNSSSRQQVVSAQVLEALISESLGDIRSLRMCSGQKLFTISPNL